MIEFYNVHILIIGFLFASVSLDKFIHELADYWSGSRNSFKETIIHTIFSSAIIISSKIYFQILLKNSPFFNQLVGPDCLEKSFNSLKPINHETSSKHSFVKTKKMILIK